MGIPYTEAIILAGGLGTRLQSVVSEIPKPMAPIAEKPFLEYLLKDLATKGIKRAILSVGFRHEIISAHFGDHFEGIELDYVIEKEPLGTGGGIRLALAKAKEQTIFIFNGDTFFDVDLKKMAIEHTLQQNQVTVAVKKMVDFDRYGRVEIEGERIKGFHEKAPTHEGYINGGIYLLNNKSLQSFAFGKKFSFEKDFLEAFYNEIKFGSFRSDGYFLDIGIPETYEQAQTDFPKLFQKK